MALIQGERASWPKSPTTLGLFLGVISFCSCISSWLWTTTEPFENGPELPKRMGQRLDGYREMRAERRAVSPSLSQIEPATFLFIFWSVLSWVREVWPFNFMLLLSRGRDARRKLRAYFKQMSQKNGNQRYHIFSYVWKAH